MKIEVNIKNNHVRAIIFTLVLIFSISFVFAPAPTGQYHTSDELYITKNISMNNYNLTDVGAIKFPDGSVQTSASSTGGSESNCIDLSMPMGSVGDTICSDYYMTCNTIFSSLDPITISDFGFSQIISNNLPSSASGYACAFCTSYSCPPGYVRTDCYQYGYQYYGSYGCCESCSVMKATCVASGPRPPPPTYICSDTTYTDAVVKCCS